MTTTANRPIRPVVHMNEKKIRSSTANTDATDAASRVAGVMPPVQLTSEETAERFRLLADFAYDWETWKSPEGQYIYVSPSCERISGYSPQEFMEDDDLLLKIARPEDRQILSHHRATELENYGPMQLEFRIIHRNGSERWISHVCQQVITGAGKYVGTRASNRDISDRRKAEAEYETIMKTSVDGITVNDLSGRLLDVNDAYVRMTGYTRDELMGKTINDLEVKESPEEVERRIRKIMSSGYDTFEARHRRKDGSAMDIEVSVTYQNIDGGRLYSVIRDITERKRAEAKLIESEDLFRTLMADSPDMIVLVDVDGKILQASDQAASYLGYHGPEELIGRNSFELIVPDDRQKARENEQRTLGRKQVEDSEYQVYRKDGSTFFAESHTRVIKDSKGVTKGLLVSARDTTDRKMYEEHLESLNVELDSYAHMIAHDLKAPLSTLAAANALLELLIKDIREPGLEKDLREISELLERGTWRAFVLIDELLKLAESAQVPEDISLVDVAQVVRSVLDERIANAGDRRFSISIGQDLGTINASPAHIYQVFSNIIGNAIRYSDPERPRITIDRVGDPDRDVHRYVVWDNGPGFPEKDLDNLFRPFFKGKTGETGLGLFTVKKIVQLYGGDARAYNRDGACVEVYFKDLREV